jgi:hypothetical protein
MIFACLSVGPISAFEEVDQITELGMKIHLAIRDRTDPKIGNKTG